MRRHQCACTRTNRVLPQHSSAHLAATPRGCVPTHSTRSLSARAQVPSAPGSWLHFFGCGLVGIATAYAFVWITQYYTDYKYKPVRTIAEASTTGHGTNIIAGVALGLESTCAPVLVISVAVCTCVLTPALLLDTPRIP